MPTGSSLESSSEPRGMVGHLLSHSKGAGVAEITAMIAIPVGLIVGVGLLPGENSGLSQLAVMLAVVLMVALAYAGLYLRGQGWNHFGLSFRVGSAKNAVFTVIQSLVAFTAGAGLFVASAYAYSAIAGVGEAAEATGLEFLSGNLTMLFVTLATIYVTASLSEEIIYRGFFMNRIAELGGNCKAAWLIAIIISSASFGLAHYNWGTAGMVQTGFMGLGLGGVYLVFGRKLWVVILAHGYMDTALLVQAYFTELPAAAA